MDRKPTHTEITIDAGLASLCPPLPTGDAVLLEASLLAEGCRDPLVYASLDGSPTLLDGHHRHEICKRLQLPFQVFEIEVADRLAAEVWVIRNQFARRNLTPFQRAELALKLEPRLAEQAKKRMLAGKADPTPTLAQGETRDALAEIVGDIGVDDSFNGTALRRARIDADVGGGAVSARTLQWGRAPKSADRCRDRLPQRRRSQCFNGAALRRARIGWTRRRGSPELDLASMGPRSEERG